MRRFIPFVFVLISLSSCGNSGENQKAVNSQASYSVTQPCYSVKCNADSLIGFVEAQTSFGPRVPNSRAHDLCLSYISDKFKSYGADVILQSADIKAHDGTILHFTNIIASLNPDSRNRIIIAAHYDSRPWSDEEPLQENAVKPVMGANDGASGVAVMLEMARVLDADSLNGLGIDFICFDAEDYGIGSAQNSFCLGSQYWASHLHKPDYRAKYGILLDMVGSPLAQFYREQVSLHYAPDIVEKVWRCAALAGYSNLFINSNGGAITDDHLYINDVAGIPCIDIIDFIPGRGFPETWHTNRDVVGNISKKTLQSVCSVLLLVVTSK